jgi:peroxiredoxin
MKKKASVTAALLVIAFTLFYCSSRQSPAAEEKQSQPPATTQSDLPYLPLTTLEGTQMTARDIQGKAVLVLFQPDCDHCQREAAQIREHLDAFAGYALYFVSNAPPAEVARFAEEYQLAGTPNIHFATTTIEGILNTYGPVDAPSVYIYSGTGRLKKAFVGETSIEHILAFL